MILMIFFKDLRKDRVFVQVFINREKLGLNQQV